MPPFGSDNYAPTHPEVLAAIADANDGYAVAYGSDPWTDRLSHRVEELFGPGATAFPVLNGTGANVVSLMATTSRWSGVVASDVAHAHTDENGAPERVGGLKLLTRPATDGRLEIADVASWAGELGDVHRAQPAVLTLTQATELGTVYSVEQLAELTEVAHGMGMAVHVDGSRLANAAAFLGVELRALTSDVGVDVVSLGSAKNGGLLGEAVVVLSPDDAPTPRAADVRRAAAEAIPYLRKSTMQLASKTRYVSAQLLAMFGDSDLWRRNATAANAAAQRLRAGVEAMGGDVVRVTRPTESNAVFATLPYAAADRLRTQTRFYNWADGETPERVEVRWMCSWATTESDVGAFLAALDTAL
ncbi:MAG: beta-eliminating lyase-related protein [Promicromonosporaceae bacterium]|nr:beta-eliminating lyase-related protein [Promicromonosporaceae bacterium]